MSQITVQQIQGKISDSTDTKIRKAWSLQAPEEMTQALKKYPGDTRRQLYKSFDAEVQKIWTFKLKEHRENALKEGAKMIRKDGFNRLEDQYCDVADQLLIDAAFEFVTAFTHSIQLTQAK